MSMAEVIDYILHTPENSNPNVLRDMIDVMLTSLAGLRDVSILNPQPNQFLFFDETLSKWVNVNIYDKIIIE